MTATAQRVEPSEVATIQRAAAAIPDDLLDYKEVSRPLIEALALLKRAKP